MTESTAKNMLAWLIGHLQVSVTLSQVILLYQINKQSGCKQLFGGTHADPSDAITLIINTGEHGCRADKGKCQ